jgi:hypothetical protein
LSRNVSCFKITQNKTGLLPYIKKRPREGGVLV